jgi:ketosteroid isomerase-like protein
MYRRLVFMLLPALWLAPFTLAAEKPADRAAVASAIDAFHDAAARADQDAYFALMTDNVVFLGTDGTERWQGEEFRSFVSRHFSAGRGWRYRPTERHVDLAPSGRWALFDELLQHERLGQCRGSGVLVREQGRWKIAQYNLSVPIPNDLVTDVARQIRELSRR